MKRLTFVRTAIAAIVFQAFVLPGALLAQTSTATDINAAIRKEGMEQSKIMNTMHYFTDLYGPRLTGSPNHVNAAKWAAREMTSWGFDFAGLEPWEFGHPGWVNERNTGVMLTPGSAMDMEGWLRIGYANNKAILIEGLAKMTGFLSRLRAEESGLGNASDRG